MKAKFNKSFSDLRFRKGDTVLCTAVGSRATSAMLNKLFLLEQFVGGVGIRLHPDSYMSGQGATWRLAVAGDRFTSKLHRLDENKQPVLV